jgi:cytochrome c oxidase cbb3-type subunit III
MSSTSLIRRCRPLVTLITMTTVAGFAGIVGLRAQQNMALTPAHEPVAETTLFPGGGAMPPENPLAGRYVGNAEAIAAGSRLFDWYNCSGCHFHGAGGIGPSLMDDTWRYGGRIDQIVDSIARGRPNGMPSWQGKIPPNEIWEIAAYVLSLSAPSPAKGGPGEAEPPSVPPAPFGAPPPPTPETVTGMDQ